MDGTCNCDPDLHHAQSPDGGATWICGHCGKARGCPACAAIDAGGSAFCLEHGRAQIADDAPATMVRLICALAEHHGITTIVDKRQARDAAIHVDAIELPGTKDRVVRLMLPAGADSVSVALKPEIAIKLGQSLISEANKAKSPGGLILLG